MNHLATITKMCIFKHRFTIGIKVLFCIVNFHLKGHALLLGFAFYKSKIMLLKLRMRLAQICNE
jgi:hypothetical protein